jgi:glutathione synthase/RimK-type ligase-like ATP-grasp enzyme
VRLLRAQGVSYLRLNTERLLDYALEIRPLDRVATLCRGDLVIDLSSLSAVWYRRPDPPELSSVTLSNQERDVVRAQWRNSIRGLVHVLDARWINHPDRNDDAEQKLLQLVTASALGFAVPSTLVTNDAQTAYAFAGGRQGVVLKGLDAPYVEGDDGTGRFVYTTPLSDLAGNLEGLDQAPMIFQQEVNPKRDVRVTVVGDEVFAAAPVGSLGHVDWRALSDPPFFEGVHLPTEMAERCVALVQRLGLVFGAIDLVLDSLGSYWFLELNPNGEWGWLQKKIGLPIAEAIVTELTKDRS